MANNTEDVERERIATLFHNTYERLAPKYGYETRKDTKDFDPTSPNGKLMMEVCSTVVQQEANRQKAELLDRLSATIEPFSHSDSQNSNDALGFVLTTIEAERKQLKEGE